MAVAVAEMPGKAHLNPLFIYGKSGLGKNAPHARHPELHQRDDAAAFHHLRGLGRAVERLHGGQRGARQAEIQLQELQDALRGSRRAAHRRRPVPAGQEADARHRVPDIQQADQPGPPSGAVGRPRAEEHRHRRALPQPLQLGRHVRHPAPRDRDEAGHREKLRGRVPRVGRVARLQHPRRHPDVHRGKLQLEHPRAEERRHEGDLPDDVLQPARPQAGRRAHAAGEPLHRRPFRSASPSPTFKRKWRTSTR